MPKRRGKSRVTWSLNIASLTCSAALGLAILSSVSKASGDTEAGHDRAAPATQTGVPPHELAAQPHSAQATAAAAFAATHRGRTRAEAYARVRKMTDLGRQLFFDKSLSGSGKLACASCHSPDHAFGPPNAHSVQLGGSDMREAGMRAAPSLKYLQSVPRRLSE